jgi:hypothetical protein
LDDKVIEVHYHFNIPRLNTTIKKQNMEWVISGLLDKRDPTLKNYKETSHY